MTIICYNGFFCILNPTHHGLIGLILLVVSFFSIVIFNWNFKITCKECPFPLHSRSETSVRFTHRDTRLTLGFDLENSAKQTIYCYSCATSPVWLIPATSSEYFALPQLADCIGLRIWNSGFCVIHKVGCILAPTTSASSTHKAYLFMRCTGERFSST